MDSAMKDCRGVPLEVGDEVATATSSRRAGAGLRTGKVVGQDGLYICVKLDSGRDVWRERGDIVKVSA